MGNKILPFISPDYGKLRAIRFDGKPWFVAKDVAKALAYTDTSGGVWTHTSLSDRLPESGRPFRYRVPAAWSTASASSS